MQWQNTILTILDNNNASVLDLLNCRVQLQETSVKLKTDAKTRRDMNVVD